MAKKKVIGILGGMGPAASAAFYHQIISICQQKYHAIQDTDYPEMIMYSMALDGFTEEGIDNEKKVLHQLLKGIHLLENAGCDFIVIPCNTVHYFITQMRSNIQIPIVSIIEETTKILTLNGITSIGLLCSKTTADKNVYSPLEKKDIVVHKITSEVEKKNITNLIEEVMKGKINQNTKKAVIQSAQNFKDVQAIVLGCTELPLAITQKDINLPLYDSLHILAHAAVNHAFDHHNLLKHPSKFIT